MTVLRTRRLVLRPPVADDLDGLHNVYSNLRVMRYWSTSAHRDRAETRALLDAMITHASTPTRYFVIDHDGQAVGCAGLHEGDEIGFLLRADLWRKGFMREALTALIPHFLDTLGYDRLTADADPRNDGSIALLKTLGFVETGRAARTFFINGEWCDSVYFERRRT